MSARICVVTAGHLSTSPRMLKAADALHAAGYQVRVVSANHTPWATAVDRLVAAARTWEWTVVDYDRSTARALQLATGARFHAARAVSAAVGPDRVPMSVVTRAYSRAHDEIVRAVVSQPADFVYGGTTGALAAVAESAAALHVPYGIDLEDLHSAEQDGPDSDHVHALATRIESRVVTGAARVTAGSPMIAEAYAQKYGVRPIPIHNTFSLRLPVRPAAPEPDALRLYWFSQTLGPGRGLEEMVHGIGRSGVRAELHLRARPIPEYVESLRGLQRQVAPSMTIAHHEPASPDAMVELAQIYDAGFSCEEPAVPNRRLCLCNKIFTYLAAGVPVILSRTPAQAALSADLGAAAITYDCGDVDGLGDRLRRFAGDADARRQARCAARAAAARRWHWEHPDDRGALLSAVAEGLG
jgi:glycosyltransferase involved in cell wall biosynthesis